MREPEPFSRKKPSTLIELTLEHQPTTAASAFEGLRKVSGRSEVRTEYRGSRFRNRSTSQRGYSRNVPLRDVLTH